MKITFDKTVFVVYYDDWPESFHGCQKSAEKQIRRLAKDRYDRDSLPYIKMGLPGRALKELEKQYSIEEEETSKWFGHY